MFASIDPMDEPDPSFCFDSKDPFWTDPKAPHETAGVLRMFRNKIPGPEIAEMLKIDPEELQGMLRCAMDAESSAARRNVPIHDGSIGKRFS